MQPIHKGGLIALLAIGIAACSSTSVTSTWKSSAIKTVSVHKMLVVAVVPTESVRRNLENELVRELAKQGVNGTPSYLYIEDGSALDKDAVRSLVRSAGMDSVFIANYLGTTRELEYTPTTYYDYGYWNTYGGTYEERTEVKLEFRLFDARNQGRLVWSATTSTLAPESVAGAVPKVADDVVAQLEDDIER